VGTFGDDPSVTKNVEGPQVRVSRDGMLWATFSRPANKAELWNSQGEKLSELQTKGIVGEIYFSPNSKLIATVESGPFPFRDPNLWAMVRLRDIEGRQLGEIPADRGVQYVSFSPDSQLIAIVYESGGNSVQDSKLRRYSLKIMNHNGQQVTILENQVGDFDGVYFSADGKLIAIQDSNQVRLFNLQGQEVAQIPSNTLINFKLEGDSLSIVTPLGVMFGKNRNLLATLKDIDDRRLPSKPYFAEDFVYKGLELWNHKGQALGTFSPDDGTSVKFSPDGKLFATFKPAYGDKVQLWNFQGQQVAEFPSGYHTDIRFSPDGKLLAIQSDGKVVLWQIRDLDKILTEGCNYLKDYLVIHPKTLQELHVCQTKLGISPSIDIPDLEVLPKRWINLPISWNFWTFYWLFLLPSWLLYNRANIVCFPGYILRLFKQREKEILFYNTIVQFTPKWYRVWLIRGQSLSKLHQHEEAISSYDKAIQINPREYKVIALYNNAVKTNPDRATQHKSSCHMAWVNRGNVLTRLQRDKEALHSYNQALELMPGLAGLVWMSKGDVLRSLERYEESVSAYDRAMQVKPDIEIEWFWQNRGKVLRKLQRHEDALHSYNKALELDSNSCDSLYSWYGKGLALTYLEQYEEAIKAFDRLIQIRLDNLKDDEGATRVLNFEVSCYHHLMIYLGTAYALQGKIEEAQRQWHNGLEVCQEGVPWLKLSRVLYKIALGETEQGITEMQTVFEEDIPVGLIQDALEEAEMLARCSIEGSDRVVQMLKDRLQVAPERGKFSQ
jgi:tetratricopeptide (TPR) repeat protein